ncbi:MAG: ribosome biogenesis GTPase Der [Acidiferrobacterales bacterium]
MKPVVALVGRPNVGKSTLFNRLTRQRQALVADVPGLTRDRQYGAGMVGDRPYLAVDTGGLEGDVLPTRSNGKGEESLSLLMSQQVQQALHEADAILLLVDGREGMNATDHDWATVLRKERAPVWLVVNKTEGMSTDLATAEFHDLGLGRPFAISATHGDGALTLMEQVLSGLPAVEDNGPTAEIPEIAVAGRPNVGKSTLVNALLGEERVVVFDKPGTTRDSVRVPLQRGDRHYVLIDTAGVRRRPKVQGVVEKYSVVSTLKAIEAANVVILVLDADAGIGDQDAALAGFILERGRALVVAVNKWDRADASTGDWLKIELERKLAFLGFAKKHFISARDGSGVGALFASVDRAFASARRTLATPKLNRVLQGAVQASSPPRASSGPIRLKFAHQGGKNPPLVVIHGNRVDAVPATYRRYLSNAVRTGFRLEGTPVEIEFRAGENPFSRRRRPRAGKPRGH